MLSIHRAAWLFPFLLFNPLHRRSQEPSPFPPSLLSLGSVPWWCDPCLSVHIPTSWSQPCRESGLAGRKEGGGGGGRGLMEVGPGDRRSLHAPGTPWERDTLRRGPLLCRGHSAVGRRGRRHSHWTRSTNRHCRTTVSDPMRCYGRRQILTSYWQRSCV